MYAYSYSFTAVRSTEQYCSVERLVLSLCTFGNTTEPTELFCKGNVHSSESIARAVSAVQCRAAGHGVTSLRLEWRDSRGLEARRIDEQSLAGGRPRGPKGRPDESGPTTRMYCTRECGYCPARRLPLRATNRRAGLTLNPPPRGPASTYCYE